MSRDLKRISVAAIVFLVILRIGIGWQFLYEGLWKYRTQDTIRPWTAEGYLANAVGPFREQFRALADDPDGLNWLNYNHMVERWKEWQKRFTQHYGLDEQQQTKLTKLIEGFDEFTVELAELPEEVVFDGSLGGNILYRKQPGQTGELVIPRDKASNLQSPHFRRLRGFVTPQAAPEYHRALEELEQMLTAAGYKEQLAELLKENPEWTGVVATTDGEVLEENTGKVELYRKQLVEFDQAMAAASQDFEHEHLKQKWQDIQDLKTELVVPVQQLEADLKSAAMGLLTPEQQKLPPLPAEQSTIYTINWLTMGFLIGLGVLLIVGLLTRVAAFLGAGLVLSFYLVAPPLPGVPIELGPEHAFIINKNLIEVFALLALTFLPSGSWFGLDGLFRAMFVGDEEDEDYTDRKDRKTEPQTTEKAAPAVWPSKK